MKKTITINLAGLVFHIEEDAYEVLSRYLNSVRSYFGSKEGGVEIQADIESRIAELFSQWISSSKQAITFEDVQNLIKQLGTVEEITGEDLSGDEASFQAKESYDESTQSDGPIRPKRLARDTKNAILGGVLAGLAAYFEVNPLWVRLLYVAFFFGFAFLPSFGFPFLLVYLVLWIVMPADPSLDNKGNFRKLFRSRKDKVVGGVAGGLGLYFNTDPVILRVLFLGSVFLGGAGILAYIILWVIIPEAKSLTDEIQMEGNAVTLQNIEDQIKKNVNLSNKDTEKKVVRALSFPFRLVSLIVAGLGPFIRFLFDALRVFMAILLLIIGAAGLFALGVLVAASLGWVDASTYNIQVGDFPFHQIVSEITPLMISTTALAAAVPILVILMLSLSLMAQKNFFKPIVVMVLVGFFIIGSLGSAFSLVPFIKEFSAEGSRVETQAFASNYQVMQLGLDLSENESKAFPVTLTLMGTDDTTMLLVKRYKAQGASRKEATKNTEGLSYTASQVDSLITFSPSLTLGEDQKYRAQRLELKLFLPQGKKFKIDPSLKDILYKTLYPYGYDVADLDGNIWMFEQNKLKCLTCSEKNQTDLNEFDYEDENW